MPSCGIIILAAGGSTRLGTPKQSFVFDGSTLLVRAVNTAISSICRPVVVVLGSGAETQRSALEHLPVIIAINDDWQNGMGTSIRAGTTVLKSSQVDAAMIFLCDQPLITASGLDRMVEAHFATGNLMTAAFYAGSHGTPAVFDRSLFDELIGLEDNQGGKAIIKRHSNHVASFDLPEAEIDIDTKADFERLSAHRQ